jgi:hypothetical protein
MTVSKEEGSSSTVTGTAAIQAVIRSASLYPSETHLWPWNSICRCELHRNCDSHFTFERTQSLLAILIGQMPPLDTTRSFGSQLD